MRNFHTVGPEIWQENGPTEEKRKPPARTQNVARNLKKKMENGTQTLFDLECGENHSLMWKMRNTQCRTKSIMKKMKNVEIETHTLQIIEYGEKQ